MSHDLIPYFLDGLQWGIETQNEERQLAWPNETYEAELDPYHFAGDIRD